MKAPVSSRWWLVFGIITVIGIGGIVGLVWFTMVNPGPTLGACPPACPYTFPTVPSTLSPQSSEAEQIASLFWLIVGIATVIFVLVEGVLLWTVLKFKNRPAEQALQIHGNTKLEIAWTAAPALILVGVMGLTFRTMVDIRAPASTNYVTVNAVAQQFWWAFKYPEYTTSDGTRAVVTASELVVPVDTVIDVRLESKDVEHGFWVPELFGKMDAIPGYLNQMQFTPHTVGTFYAGQCTQYCGTQHAQMRFAVKVVTQAEFDAWIQSQLATAVEPAAGSAAEAGQTAFLDPRNGCIACHVVDGAGGVGLVGPNLTHVAERQFLAGGIISNTPENMARWLASPQTVKPGSKMVLPRALDDATIESIVAYLGTLN
ncbi:MAG: cytochrome c oxidase subunit II [Anaerolineales bacterium]|nr:cytochrome c oxidase subunit II [Anaerolineales bacterium]